MATIKGTKRQARKRHRQSEQRRLRNRSVRTRIRRQMRKVREASAEGNSEQATKMLPETMSVIDVARRKGVLHRNTAARYKARMARQARAATATDA